MAREGKSRPAPEPTTIHEICRRYVATATTLAKVMGVPLTEAFMQEHHQAIACCFIESGRAGVRLRASVTLPPVAGEANGKTESIDANGQQGNDVSAIAEHGNGHAPPTTIPADGDLPCAGQEITALKPAQLAMLLAKVARLVQDHQDDWVPLLHALQAERQARVAKGQRRVRTSGPIGDVP
jgi:hypothetical protein